jgi:AcrR family transcriptional regulator
MSSKCWPRSPRRRPASGPAVAAPQVALVDDVHRIVPLGTARPTAIPAEIFAAALDTFAAGQRLDMQALARRLGLARATLYRQAGNREQLLDEVVWWLSRRALVAAVERSRRSQGVARIVSIVGGILHAVEADRSLRVFLETDPEAALRILTGSRSTVQKGMAAALETVLSLELERGHFRTELDAPTLAYAIVRITEGFLYSDVIADRTPDIDRAITVVDALLRGLDTAQRPAP